MAADEALGRDSQIGRLRGMGERSTKVEVRKGNRAARDGMAVVGDEPLSTGTREFVDVGHGRRLRAAPGCRSRPLADAVVVANREGEVIAAN